MKSMIVEDIGKVVASMRAKYDGVIPYYMWGHRKVIAKQLTSQGKDKSFTYQRYPVIVLFMDFVEREEGGLNKFTLTIGIFTHTEKTYDPEQRKEISFKPVLIPLYDQFIEALRNSYLFMWEGDPTEPPKEKIDRPFWGSEEKNKNIFNDPLDAIEIRELSLSQLAKRC